VRAADYQLPAEVEAAVAAVFGLHGLPLAPRAPLSIAAMSAAPPPPPIPIMPKRPANVTPAVLATTYHIGAVKASRSSKNRQAVAEFQAPPPAAVKSFMHHPVHSLSGTLSKIYRAAW
jgi:hypothetical protein